jgi:hypothetical protein
LSDDAVRQIADAVLAGSVPLNYHHDLARPSATVAVQAGVETLEDGHLVAWAEIDVDEEEWRRFEEETIAAGAP